MYNRAVVEKKSNYPFVLVHGFLGWGDEDLLSKVVPYYGAFTGNVTKMAKNLGFECYSPSLGPFNGAWDRACELWAQLVGGTVDYGKVHSEKHNHKRYGRTYKALIPDWGKLDAEGKIKKINLIGHSSGGPTIRMFVFLLVKGSQEERLGTPENELSELFKGGHKNWVHSITTLAASHNGISFAELLGEKGRETLIKLIGYAGAVVGKTPIMKIYDFRLEQFEITQQYKGKFGLKINREGINRLANNKIDNIVYELTLEGSKELTKDFTAFDNIYYFSYAGCRTKEKDGRHIPLKKTFAGIKPVGYKIGKYTNSDSSKGAIIDKEWLPSDGVVNVVSALAPFDEKQEDFVSTDKCVSGVWYKMPIEEKDHQSYQGLGEKKDIYATFFYDIMNRVSNLPTVN